MKGYSSITILSLSFLVACTSIQRSPEFLMKQPHPPEAPTPEGTQTATIPKTDVSTLSSWDISGAIAAKNRQKSWTATINWLQIGANHYQIRLMGPLGGGSIIVEKQNGVVMYRDGSKKITSPNAEALLYSQTGVRLPVNNLYYWVRGIPAPGPVETERLLHDKLFAQFRQNNYTVTYGEYMTVNGLTLPAKIKLEGHGVLIKLVIKHWTMK